MQIAPDAPSRGETAPHPQGTQWPRITKPQLDGLRPAPLRLSQRGSGSSENQPAGSIRGGPSPIPSTPLSGPDLKPDRGSQSHESRGSLTATAPRLAALVSKFEILDAMSNVEAHSSTSQHVLQKSTSPSSPDKLVRSLTQGRVSAARAQLMKSTQQHPEKTPPCAEQTELATGTQPVARTSHTQILPGHEDPSRVEQSSQETTILQNTKACGRRANETQEHHMKSTPHRQISSPFPRRGLPSDNMTRLEVRLGDSPRSSVAEKKRLFEIAGSEWCYLSNPKL